MNRNAMGRGAAVLAMIAGTVGTLALAACWSAKIELTGDHGGAAISASGASGSSGSAAAPAPPAVCFADAGLVDGAGYSGIMPSWCGDAPGAPIAFSSSGDVTTAVAGTWFDCDNGSFFSVVDGALAGVQITSDGHINSLHIDGDTKLASQSDYVAFYGSIPESGQNVEGNNRPFGTATYVIVDASATLGAGTFQIRITGSDGSIEQAQILVYGSPDRLKLVLDNQSVTLVRAVPLQYRANICVPAFDGGTPLEAGSLFVGITPGRWIWCGGGGYPAFGYGFDLQADGTGDSLDIDSTGNFVGTWANLFDGGVAHDQSPGDFGHGDTASISACPAALQIADPYTNGDKGGFYQPIPPQ